MICITEIFRYATPGRGPIEITVDLSKLVRHSGIRCGIATAFVRHTSASLLIYENADPSARHDLEDFFQRLAPDGDPRYSHEAEGDDDMSAHIRMSVTRTSEVIPIHNGSLALGTWQGLFLYEHRTSPHRREVAVSLMGQ